MAESVHKAEIRVLLADDHPVVRGGIRRLVDKTAGMHVIAEVETGEEAVACYQRERPDVVLMDLSMPGIGGLEALRRILAKDPDARVIVFSVHDDVLFVKRVLGAGARGYLTKRSAPDDVIDAMRSVMRGEHYIEHSLANVLVADGAQGGGATSSLTDRELVVLRMLVQGKSVSEIGESLFISPKTVGTHQTRIFKKLNVGNLASLTRWAIRNGIVEP